MRRAASLRALAGLAAGLLPRDPSARAQGVSALAHAALFALLALQAQPAQVAPAETYKVRFHAESAREAADGAPKRSRQTAKKETLRPERSAVRAATGRDPKPDGGRRKNAASESFASGLDGARPRLSPDVSRLLEVDDRIAPRPAEPAAAQAASDDPSPVLGALALSADDMPLPGERRTVNLSDKLDVSDETGASPRSDRSGGGLEFGLLENSSYTLMPEFLWGAPEIAYPESARRRGSEGQVLLVLEILENGEVGMVRAAETPLDPELSDFLVRAAGGWRFKPMYRDGKPLTGTVSVRVRYTLDPGATGGSAAAGSSGERG